MRAVTIVKNSIALGRSERLKMEAVSICDNETYSR